MKLQRSHSLAVGVDMDQCAKAPSRGFITSSKFISLNGKEEEQMSDLHPAARPWQMIDGLRQWWRNWRAAGSRLTELACCGEYEVERMARVEDRRILRFVPRVKQMLQG